MRLVWSTFALSEPDGIFTNIEAENPAGAIATDERIDFAVRRLVDFPESGRAGRVDGTRELPVTVTPYIATYIATEQTVRIFRILHGAQRWPETMREEKADRPRKQKSRPGDPERLFLCG